MALIRATSGGGGGGLNPTLVKTGVLGKTSSTKTATQQLDLTKTYIVSNSVNYESSTTNYMTVHKIVKGVVSGVSISSDNTAVTVTVDANGLLTLTNSSTSASRSYCLTQID